MQNLGAQLKFWAPIIACVGNLQLSVRMLLEKCNILPKLIFNPRCRWYRGWFDATHDVVMQSTAIRALATQWHGEIGVPGWVQPWTQKRTGLGRGLVIARPVLLQLLLLTMLRRAQGLRLVGVDWLVQSDRSVGPCWQPCDVDFHDQTYYDQCSADESGCLAAQSTWVMITTTVRWNSLQDRYSECNDWPQWSTLIMVYLYNATTHYRRSYEE